MRYKEQILQKVDAIENQLKYASKAMNSKNITANELIALLNQNIKKLEAVKSLIEAE